MTKKEREASAARHAEETVAREAGRDFFEKRPDLMLVEVHRYANRLYEQHYMPMAFAEGYQARRRQRDEYHAEMKAAAEKKTADKVADHIDGFDRDDLGESPDY